MLGWLGVHAAPMQGLDIHDPAHGLNRIPCWRSLGQSVWGFSHEGFGHRQCRFGDGSEVVSSLNIRTLVTTFNHMIQETDERLTSRQTATLPLARVISM